VILFPEKHVTESLQNYSITFKDVTDCKSLFSMSQTCDSVGVKSRRMFLEYQLNKLALVEKLIEYGSSKCIVYYSIILWTERICLRTCFFLYK